MTSEQRQRVRAHVLRRGKIVFRNGYGAVDCVVLDISSDGARVRVGGWLGLPNRFQLRIDNGTVHDAEVRYRRLDEIGVQFVDARAA